MAIPFSKKDLPDPGIEPGSPALQADSLPSEPPSESQGDRIAKQVTEEGFQSGQFTKLSTGCKGGQPRVGQGPGAGNTRRWGNPKARQGRAGTIIGIEKRALGGR